MTLLPLWFIIIFYPYSLLTKCLRMEYWHYLHLINRSFLPPSPHHWNYSFDISQGLHNCQIKCLFHFTSSPTLKFYPADHPFLIQTLPFSGFLWQFLCFPSVSLFFFCFDSSNSPSEDFVLSTLLFSLYMLSLADVPCKFNIFLNFKIKYNSHTI